MHDQGFFITLEVIRRQLVDIADNWIAKELLRRGTPSAQNPNHPPTRQSWFSASHGNPYIGSALTTLDPGTGYQEQMKTEQTLDNYGK